MQSFWLLLEKHPAPLWWILVFWLLICLNRNYLYILARLSDSPCDYCLWKWERRSRKFPCHQSLMYTQIMGWLQLRWAPRRIVCLCLWQLPPWQGLLVFLVIDAFCINVICWWCVPPYTYGGRHPPVCVWAWGGNGVFNPHRGREASISPSSLNVFYSPQFRKADQKWIAFKGASASVTAGHLSELLLRRKRGKLGLGGWAAVKWHVWGRWGWQSFKSLIRNELEWLLNKRSFYHNVDMQIQSWLQI